MQAPGWGERQASAPRVPGPAASSTLGLASYLLTAEERPCRGPDCVWPAPMPSPAPLSAAWPTLPPCVPLAATDGR